MKSEVGAKAFALSLWMSVLERGSCCTPWNLCQKVAMQDTVLPFQCESSLMLGGGSCYERLGCGQPPTLVGGSAGQKELVVPRFYSGLLSWFSFSFLSPWFGSSSFASPSSPLASSPSSSCVGLGSSGSGSPLQKAASRFIPAASA